MPDIDIDSALPGGQDSITKGPPKPPPGSATASASSSVTAAPAPNPTGDPLGGIRGSAIEPAVAALDRLLAESQKKASEAPPVPSPEPKLPAEPAKLPAKSPSESGEPPAAPAPPAGDPFDAVSLPANVSTRARDSFESIKQTARARIAEVEKVRAETAQELEGLKTKLGGKSVDDLVKEAQDLRGKIAELETFRKHADIDSAPEFKSFDERVQRNSDQIISRLTEWGMSEEQLASVKQIGVDKLNWDAIYTHLTPAQKRFVEARLLDTENAQQERSDAVKAAKQNSEQFFRDRGARAEQERQVAQKARETVAADLAKDAKWLMAQAPAKDATPEQIKVIEAQNRFTEDLNTKLKEALSDTSPEMHAALAYGNTMAFWLSAQNKALDRALQQVEKERSELQEKLDRIRKSSRSKGSDSPTIEPSVTRRDPNQYTPGLRTEEALDRLLAEATAGQ